jgi:hypothetical protein
VGYGNMGKKAPVVYTPARPSTVGQGAPADVSGAWPVQVTDGASVLGTADNPLVVNASNVVADDGNTRRLLELELLRVSDMERLALRTRHGERVSSLAFSRGSR